MWPWGGELLEVREEQGLWGKPKNGIQLLELGLGMGVRELDRQKGNRNIGHQGGTWRILAPPLTDQHAALRQSLPSLFSSSLFLLALGTEIAHQL